MSFFKTSLAAFAAMSITSAHAAVLYVGFTDPGPLDPQDESYFSEVGSWSLGSNDGSALFTLSSPSTLTGFEFTTMTGQGGATATEPSSTVKSLDWQVTSDSTFSLDGLNWTPSGTTFGSGAAAVTMLSWIPRSCGEDYDCETNLFSLPNVALPAGTYWLTMSGADSVRTDGSQTDTLWRGNFAVLGSDPPAVPEPASIALMAVGLVGLGAVRKRA